MAEHSHLGGSGTYRWIACPGSVALSEGVADAESDYAAEGTAAHALAEHCLRHGQEAWQHIGQALPGNSTWTQRYAVSKDMADAVQVYLDAVRAEHPDRNQGNTWIERAFECPHWHPAMFGRADFVHADFDQKVLHVWDYKHGAGIVVDAVDNPQLKYYAVGMLTELRMWGEIDTVVVRICQPRGFHILGPTREWSISTADLAQWGDDVLIPAMELADSTRSKGYTPETLLGLGLLTSGEHCRFCPARRPTERFCPRLERDMAEMEALMNDMATAGGPGKVPSETLGAFLGLFEKAKILQKAAREVAFARAQEGHTIPGWKLAKARANREWKEGTLEKATAQFGQDALTKPELQSPATIDKLPGGKKFTAEWAFKPEAGLQLVPDDDARPEAGPRGRAMFEPVKRERERA